MKRRKIELQIDELVLHGFARRERYVIAEAIQRELTALLKTRGLPGGTLMSHEYETVHAAEVRVSGTPHTQITGAKIAAAIYGGLTR